jgi:ATP-dependent Lon protease
MNPIIFIDEVDKISKTEQGRDIVGILIHLLDSTQNDCFQDKYFSGIDIDLSKALFILSYNDASSIDRILLDRIHRVKFNNLSLDDKIVIARNHILPEVFTKMGMHDMIHFTDEVLRFIIDEYTMEAGVRKLKEALFEIVGEINLDILKQADLAAQEFPIQVTKSDIQTKYFKDRREVRIKRIHPESAVGVINCLWANDYGNGGILSANGKFVPADKFLDLKMTGLLDDMMRESFQISLTLAYDLTPESQKQVLRERFKEKPYGIHLHMGDGSVNKSGTSAGIAIALLMYSLLNGKKIRNDFAVTGEAADLNGSSGEIGALKVKFISGIKAGVKNFIYPRENERDYREFMEKYAESDLVKGIRFYAIDNIQEAIDLIIEKDEHDE